MIAETREEGAPTASQAAAGAPPAVVPPSEAVVPASAGAQLARPSPFEVAAASQPQGRSPLGGREAAALGSSSRTASASQLTQGNAHGRPASPGPGRRLATGSSRPGSAALTHSRPGSAAVTHSCPGSAASLHSRLGSATSLRSLGDSDGGGLPAGEPAPTSAPADGGPMRSGGTRTRLLSLRPSLRGGIAETGSQSSVTLESVMSQVQLTAEGPCECRILMPGLDLAEHGLAELDLQSFGGDLPVVTAPRGVNLRMAISQAMSQQLEGSSSVQRSGMHLHASMPGTPATLPCVLGSTTGTPLVPPLDSLASASAVAVQGQQQPQDGEQGQGQGERAGEFGLPAPDQQPEGAASDTAWQWLLQSRFAAGAAGGGGGRDSHEVQAPSLAGLPPQPPQSAARLAGAAAGQQAVSGGAEGAVALPASAPAQQQQQQQQEGQQRARHSTLEQLELLETGGPLVRLEGARPWSYDGAPAAGAALPGSPPRQLEIAYRSRAAARMWPMLAPFVPRLLRQYIVQAQPAARSSSAQSPVFQGIGKALACPASAPTQSLSRMMRPAMESFPAAVMIADVSGFTALTEALGGQGSAGVELLTKCMNRYFTQVIDLLLLYGGDVEKFAGDCMIVVFLPTQQEADESKDGGLAAATLRAVTCGSELATKFGAMRMLPNGEVVPIPAAERRGGGGSTETRPTAAAGEDYERREDSFHECFVPRLASRGASAAFLAARGSAQVAARAASTGARAAGLAAGGSARAAVAVLGAGTSVATKAAASPHKLLTRRQRGVRSEMHLPLPVAASGRAGSLDTAASLDGPPSRTSSGGFSSLLLRTHSSPDPSLLPGLSSVASLASGGGDASEGSSPRVPARSLLRQSSSMAAAVLSRLSRGSSPPSSHHGRQRSAQLSADVGADQPQGGQHQGQEAAAEGAPGPAAGSTALQGTSQHREGGSTDGAASADQQRLQRERRLHEQALAELAMLAGPAGGSRPPELPSAKATAEVAAARLLEQRALHQQHKRRPSLPSVKAATLADSSGMGSAGAGAGGNGSSAAKGEAAGPRVVPGRTTLRSSLTAPPTVSSLLHDLAVEEMGRLAGVQEDEVDVESAGTSATAGAPPVRSSPRPSRGKGAVRHLPPLVSGVAFEEEAVEEEEGEGAEQQPEARRHSQGGTSLPPPSSNTAAAGTSQEEATCAPVPEAQALGAEASPPPASCDAAPLEKAKSVRPSMLQRMLSVAALPWRGRTVSSGGGNEGSMGGCQSSGVSMMSDSTVAPWNASLAELSSGLGLPTSATSQGFSNSVGNRLFGRRSHHQRQLSGLAGCLPPTSVGPQSSSALSQGRQQGDASAEGCGLPQPTSPGATAAFSSDGAAAMAAECCSSGGFGSSPFQAQSSGSPGPAPGMGPGPGGSQQHVQALMQRVVLSLKVVVAAGTACAFHVGGSLESSADDASGVPRWEFFIGDAPHPEQDTEDAQGDGAPEGEAVPQPRAPPRPPIAQLQAAERHAISGEAILSPEVVHMVQDFCLLEPTEDGNACLLELLHPYHLPPEAQQEAGASSLERAAKQIARERAALAALPETAQGHALQLLRMHLLENVRLRVEAGHIDYVNELRVGTVLFLGFPSLLEPPPKSGPGASRTGLAAVQACMEAVQKRMRQHDGSLLQFRCDEKGFLAICAFGLPGRSHEDGPARGIQAALAIVEAIKKRGGRACCGVTTGQLFCAMVGSQRRSEYTVFGNAINLSARLMVRARDRAAEVYCDATTQQLAKHKARYLQLDPVRVKGRQAPVDIFEVTSLHAEGTAGGSSNQQRVPLSPLGRPPLLQVEPACKAAAVAAAAGLSRGGGGAAAAACAGPGVRAGGTGEAPTAPAAGTAGAETGAQHQSAAAEAAGLEGLATALVPNLGTGDPQQQPLQEGEQQECGQAGQSLQLDGRLLSVASTSAAPMQLMPHTPMIARDAELAAITERCVQLVEQRRGGLVMVEGEAGMGKSRLVEELQHSELGGVYESCNLFLGLGRRERKSQALYPWRRVLREMFHHDSQLGQVYCLRGTNPVVVATELALRLRAAVPDFAQWRHLLADALDLPLSELPAALPTLEQHRRNLVAQSLQEGLVQGTSPDPLELGPEVQQALFSAGDLAALPEGLGEEEAEFLSGADRAKSFASRMKRSASLNLGFLGRTRQEATGAWSKASALDAARAATPSPRKLTRVRQQQEAAVWQQAQAAAAAHHQSTTHHASSVSASSASSEGGQYSDSDAGSYISSAASSFSAGSSSMHSMTGSPAALASLGASGEAMEGGSGGRRGRRGLNGSSRRDPRAFLQRSATSRGAGGFALRSSSPGREISTHLRVKKVQELVVAIIRQFTEAYGPLILVLEDLHHFDTASWRLLTTAVSDAGLKQSVLFVVTYRPYFGALSPALRQRGGSKELLYHHVRAAYRAVLDQPTTLHLNLQPFSMEQSRQFVSAALGGAQVPREVAGLLWERSSGLPSFLEQLVVFLQLFVQTQMQSSSAAVPEDGEDNRPRRRSTLEEVQAMAQAGLDFIRSNVSINSIITDRVDRLRPDEQLTLKVASVLGLTVYRQLLQAIHPQQPQPAALEASLCALEAASFLGRDPQEPTTWRFCQVLARDVVYELVPQDVRRDWHAAAAAAMEAYSSDQIHLPASTIAWHWDHGCRGVEAPHWQRSFRAVDWWERAAASSLDNGAYADALPLLQRAQDVAEALDRYFVGHSRSFWLMVQDQAAATGAPGTEGQAAALAGLPTGLTALTLDSLVSTRGTASLHPPTELALPLVPRLRRAHWERCMAAMCVAAEVSAEALHEAKVHCLIALYLLGVPLPSSEEYVEWQHQQERRWWPQVSRLPWLPAACAGPSSCRRAGDDPIQRRSAEMEAGVYVWMARPDPVVSSGSTGRRGHAGWTNPSRSMVPATAAAASTAAPSVLGCSTPAWQCSAVEDASSGDVAGSGEPWQQPCFAGGAASTLSGGAPLQAPQAAAPAASAGPGAFNIVGGTPLWGVPAQVPSSSLPPPPAAVAAEAAAGTHGGGTVGAAGAASPWGRTTQQPGSDAVQDGAAGVGSTVGYGGPAVPLLLRPSPFAARPAETTRASAAEKPPARSPRISGASTLAVSGPAALPMGSSGSRYSGTLGRPPALHSGSGGPSLSAQSTPEEQQQQQQQQPGMLLRQAGTAGSTPYRPWQAAGLEAAAAAAAAGPPAQQPSGAGMPGLQQGGMPSSLSVLPGYSACVEADSLLEGRQDQWVQQRRERLHEQAVAIGLAAKDERYTAQAKAEAAVVLDLLCSLLLAVPPRLADTEGARYVRWACMHLQGGKVRRSSAFWQVYQDCDAVLRSHSQRRAAGKKKPLQEGGTSASAPRLARRSVPQSLAAIAGVVGSVVGGAGCQLKASFHSGAGAGDSGGPA